MYGTESTDITKYELKALDFVVNRCLMKCFKTNDINLIDECCRYFYFDRPSDLFELRMKKFVSRFSTSVNVLCLYSSYMCN